MRCLDQYRDFIFQGAATQAVREKVINHLTAVDIDNAVRWFFEKNSQEYWDYEQDFPCVLSPWMFAWYEAGTPAYSNSEGEIKDIGARNVFRKWGWNVQQIPLKRDIELPREPIMATLLRKIYAHKTGQEPREMLYSDEQMADITERRPAHTQMAMCWGFRWEGDPIPLMAELAYLDESGRMIASSRGAMLLLPYQAEMTEEQKQEAVIELEAAFLSLYFAICLLHTKNVIVKDEASPRTKHNRHATTNRTPQTRFKVLNITPLRQEVRRALVTDTTSSEIKKALHLCRGHYRRYTEESKLFGKHTGIFWIPAHMRGSKEAGEIRKDYKVLSPKIRTDK